MDKRKIPLGIYQIRTPGENTEGHIVVGHFALFPNNMICVISEHTNYHITTLENFIKLSKDCNWYLYNLSEEIRSLHTIPVSDEYIDVSMPVTKARGV